MNIPTPIDTYAMVRHNGSNGAALKAKLNCTNLELSLGKEYAS